MTLGELINQNEKIILLKEQDQIKAQLLKELGQKDGNYFELLKNERFPNINHTLDLGYIMILVKNGITNQLLLGTISKRKNINSFKAIASFGNMSLESLFFQMDECIKNMFIEENGKIKRK